MQFDDSAGNVCQIRYEHISNELVAPNIYGTVVLVGSEMDMVDGWKYSLSLVESICKLTFICMLIYMLAYMHTYKDTYL